MQPFLRLFLTAVIVLVSAGLSAQEVYHSQDPDLLARLSYDGPVTVQLQSARQVCVAVSREGDYKMVRLLNNGETQRLQGKMPKDQLQKLKTLLDTAEFRALAGNHGGLVRQP